MMADKANSNMVANRQTRQSKNTIPVKQPENDEVNATAEEGTPSDAEDEKNEEMGRNDSSPDSLASSRKSDSKSESRQSFTIPMGKVRKAIAGRTGMATAEVRGERATPRTPATGFNAPLSPELRNAFEKFLTARKTKERRNLWKANKEPPDKPEIERYTPLKRGMSSVKEVMTPFPRQDSPDAKHDYEADGAKTVEDLCKSLSIKCDNALQEKQEANRKLEEQESTIQMLLEEMKALKEQVSKNKTKIGRAEGQPMMTEIVSTEVVAKTEEPKLLKSRAPLEDPPEDGPRPGEEPPEFSTQENSKMVKTTSSDVVFSTDADGGKDKEKPELPKDSTPSKSDGYPRSKDDGAGKERPPPPPSPPDSPRGEGEGGGKIPTSRKDRSNRITIKGIALADWHKLRPDIQRAQNYLKIIEKEKIKVKKRADWPTMKKHLGKIASSEGWPLYILDLKADPWDELVDEEDPVDRKAREEAAMIISGCIDKEMHGSKLEAIQDREVQNNAQMLYRRLDKFFAIGTLEGDVTTAGKDLRQCTQESTGLSVLEFGIELDRREKVLNNMGVFTDVHKELKYIYLNGLLKSFKGIKDRILYDMEPDRNGEIVWNPDYVEVRETVEQRAIRDKLVDLVAGGGAVQQNNQQVKSGPAKASPTKLTKGQKKKNKKIAQLQAQIDQMSATTNGKTAPAKGGAKTGKSDKLCSHDAKCWRKDCKYKHSPGHVPAQDPKSMTCSKCSTKGHSAEQCGKCFKCGSADHKWKDCPDRKTVSQNNQQIICDAGDHGGPTLESENGGCLIQF